MDSAVDDHVLDTAIADHVVLLDEQDHPVGTADRATVHSAHTPRHLAFSCWIVSTDGTVLITRRGLDKGSWPGVWTNSCCGHPRPGEPLEQAVRRRVVDELGLELLELVCLLPDFSYRAADYRGIVEDELCPVFRAVPATAEPTPDPYEVAEWRWQPAAGVLAAMEAAPYAFSPWSIEQGALLADMGVLESGPRC